MFFGATFPILLLIFFLLSIVSDPSSATINVGTSDETIQRICKQALDYHFCRITLLSWDGIEYADTNELGNVAILSATIYARSNKYIDRYFLANGAYLNMQDQLTDCLVDHNVTLGKLEAAYRLSDRRDYVRMYELVHDAMTMITKCDFSLVSVSYDRIWMYNRELMMCTHIALVVLSELKHQLVAD